MLLVDVVGAVVVILDPAVGVDVGDVDADVGVAVAAVCANATLVPAENARVIAKIPNMARASVKATSPIRLICVILTSLDLNDRQSYGYLLIIFDSSPSCAVVLFSTTQMRHTLMSGKHAI